jgi:predicted nucleotidyltransferase
MRLHATLDDVLGTPARVAVLRVLLTEPRSVWTGRALAQRAGRSVPQTGEALRRLESVGLVWRRVRGRSHLWQLDRKHVLVAPLRSLFGFERTIPDRFREELQVSLRGLPHRQATLFGSIARGDEKLGSDADLFIELGPTDPEPELQRALTKVCTRIAERYGIVLSPLVYPPARARRPPNPALRDRIVAEGIPLVPARP